MSAEDEDEIIQRHRKESKDLQVKCAALKKSAPVSDKKRRKEVLAEIEALEKALSDRHQAELSAFQSQNQNDPISSGADKSAEDLVVQVVSLSVDSESQPEQNGDEDNEAEEKDAGFGKKMTRAQRRKMNKEAKLADARKDWVVEEVDSNYVSPRVTEKLKLKKILDDLDLKLVDMPSDGNCLYSSLSYQLRLDGTETSVRSLRQSAVSFMRSKPDEFLPFLHHDSGDSFTEEDYARYCSEMENTSAWGSQLELRALSGVLGRCIRVLQAEGPNVVIGEESEGEPLTVVYHRHELSLGEHYNSVGPR